MMRYRTLFRWFLVIAVAGSISAGIGAATYRWTGSIVERAAADDALDRAVKFVGEEVDYIADETVAERHFYALLSAASYVQANLSSARWGRSITAGAKLAGMSSGQCLAQGVGICGSHAMTVFTILDALDVPARVVALYYVSDSGERAAHVVIEVEWAGKWHMMDVTWGFLPIGDGGAFDVLSVEEVLQGSTHHGYVDDLHPWTFQYRRAGLNPLNYIGADPDVVVSGAGTIRPVLDDGDASSYALNDIPAYVGHGFSSDGRLGEIRYSLEPPTRTTTLTVKVTHWNCDDGGSFVVNDVAYPFEREMVFTDLDGPIVLRVEANGDSDHCYLSLGALEIG